MPDRSIQQYLELPYRVEMFYSNEDEAWVARFPELPGCVADGATKSDALALAEEMKALWIETAANSGDPIPEPKPEPTHSGRLVLRLPRSLHEDAASQAAREQVSLNTYLVGLISEGLQRSLFKTASDFISGMVQRSMSQLPAASTYRIMFGFSAEPIYGEDQEAASVDELVNLPKVSALDDKRHADQ